MTAAPRSDVPHDGAGCLYLGEGEHRIAAFVSPRQPFSGNFADS
jgi:hypothetical protein